MRPPTPARTARVSHNTWFALILCGAMLLVACAAVAQSTSTGTIVGQVTDSSGAVVPDATVSLIDRTTGTSKTVTTNEAGRYVFVNVNPGSYDVTYAKTGFAQAKFSSQDVSIGRQLTLNATLKVGAANEQIVVEASGATLQTLNATVGTTIAFRNLQELPNLSRDVSSLMTIQPATAPNGSVAGAVRDQNTFQLDGGNNSSPAAQPCWNGAGAQMYTVSEKKPIAGIHFASAIRYPTRHPVTLYVFEKPEMVTVRSFMSGSVAMLICVWPG